MAITTIVTSTKLRVVTRRSNYDKDSEFWQATALLEIDDRRSVEATATMRGRKRAEGAALVALGRALIEQFPPQFEEPCKSST